MALIKWQRLTLPGFIHDWEFEICCVITLPGFKPITLLKRKEKKTQQSSYDTNNTRMYVVR